MGSSACPLYEPEAVHLCATDPAPNTVCKPQQLGCSLEACIDPQFLKLGVCEVYRSSLQTPRTFVEWVCGELGAQSLHEHSCVQACSSPFMNLAACCCRGFLG